MSTLKRLNELSRQTLSTYTRHAARELEAHSYFQGYSAGSKSTLPGDNPVKTKRLLMRRLRGLDAATKKLAREDVNEGHDSFRKALRTAKIPYQKSGNDETRVYMKHEKRVRKLRPGVEHGMSSPYYDNGIMNFYEKEKKKKLKEEVLTEAAAKKKPASGAVTVTVKTGASGGQAAGGKDKKKKKSSAAGSQKSMGKTLRDLLAHHDSASTYHRQKAAEHQEFQVYHNKARDMRHLGPLHKKAQEAHENLRHVYHKLSNATYNAIKRLSEPKEKKK